MKIEKQLFLILFCFGILPFQVQGQKNRAYKHPGMVITLEGDTIQGKFKMTFPADRERLAAASKEFKFKADEGDRELKIYTTSHLKYVEYTLLDVGEKKTFESRKIPVANGNVWEFIPPALISGPISIYQDIELRHPFGRAEFVYRTLIEKNGLIRYVSSDSIYEILSALMMDCPNLAKKRSTQNYKKKNSLELIQEYNECME